MLHDRRFLSIFIIVLIYSAFILASCSENTPKAKPELTFILFSDDKAQISSIKALADDFNKMNSDLVNVEVYGTKLEPFIIDSILKAGKPFDMMLVSAEYLSDLLAYDMLMEFSKSPSGLDQALMNSCRWDNKLFGIPFYFDINLIYLNKKLIEKYNYISADIEYWSDLIDIASEINSPDTHYGCGIAIDDARLIVQNFASFCSSSAFQDSVELDDAGIAAAVNYLGELSRNGLIESASYLENLFIAGKLGIYIGGLDLAPKINSLGIAQNYQMMKLPKLSDANISSTLSAKILVAAKKSDSITIHKFTTFFDNQIDTSDQPHLLKSQQNRYTKEQRKLIDEIMNNSNHFPKLENWSLKKSRIENEFIKIMKAEDSYLELLDIFNY